MLRRLKVKDKPFAPFSPAFETDIDALWNEAVYEWIKQRRVQNNLERKTFTLFYNNAVLQDNKCFFKFDNCNICRPARLPHTVFDSLSVLPDGHYIVKSFVELRGTPTYGSFRLSLQKVKKKQAFSASIQHVKNVDMMLRCEECSMWRLLYSRCKLTRQEKAELEAASEDPAIHMSSTNTRPSSAWLSKWCVYKTIALWRAYRKTVLFYEIFS